MAATDPDIVYFVRQGEKNQELRYSLRSLRNLPHNKVWVIGHCPGWVEKDRGQGYGVQHIYLPQGNRKYLNVAQGYATLVATPGISENFYLFNDDFYIIEPIAEVLPLHRGPVSAHIDKHRDSYGNGKWIVGAEYTQELLVEYGIADPLSYSLHIPLLMNKTELAEVLEIFQVLDVARSNTLPNLHVRTLYGNYADIGGEMVFDVKVANRRREALLRVLDRGLPYLSTSDSSFAGEIGRYLMGQFRSASPYETGRNHRNVPVNKIKRIYL